MFHEFDKLIVLWMYTKHLFIKSSETAVPKISW